MQDLTVFIFSLKGLFSLNIKTIRSFETSETTNPGIKRHIAEE